MSDLDKELMSIADADNLRDSARVDYLKKQWGISDLRVQGRLKKMGDLWWLTDVRSENGTLLHYPFSDLSRPLGHERPGVFVGPESVIPIGLSEPDLLVSTILEIASKAEREKQNNPLLVQANPRLLKLLTSISSEYFFYNEDGISVPETVRQHYIAQCRKEAEAELAKLNDELSQGRRRSDALTAEVIETQQKIKQEEASLQEAEAHAIMAQEELQAIKEELAEARKQRDRERGRIESQADELRAYVKARIAPLRRLELVTQAQLDSLFPGDNVAGQREDNDWPLFDGKTTPIDHIQRYLFGKGIGYPLDLLENFHALLGTGDLIILSGLSGSGKTNLVKSYAEATGNEHRIIPVKPNWTSAEDLLGFHNPLQRAYAPTPFLEALFDAQRDPERLYIICLDEMNLARVEYYFADFLSRLEDRKGPSIQLYPDDELGHVKTELLVLLETLGGLNVDENSATLQSLLADGGTMTALAQRLGLGDRESFPKLHGRIRRMLTGALTVHPTLSIPANVRFVGAINMDDTTHYLSPKVLDRAYVLQFQSPLDYWRQVDGKLGDAEKPRDGIRIPASAFYPRCDYPDYQPTDPLVKKLTSYVSEFLKPLGIELGMRPLRQALLYQDRLREVFKGDSLELLALNHLLRQKVLPRFSFDGKQRARGRGEQTCDAVVRAFRDRLVEDLSPLQSKDISPSGRATDEINSMIERAVESDGVYNYWS
ncbi:MAG: hypothetical protein C1943_09090 [Halochromatium sp.]|nr:hypothetical protein [Halochromatium sp.]